MKREWKMSKITVRCAIFIIGLSLLIFSSCQFQKSDSEIANDWEKTIISCINNHDTENLKESFSCFIVQSHNIDNESDKLFKCFRSKIVESTDALGGGRESWRNEKCVLRTVTSSFNVTLENGREYTIIVGGYVNSEDDSKLGIKVVDVRWASNNALICRVGEWDLGDVD